MQPSQKLHFIKKGGPGTFLLSGYFCWWTFSLQCKSEHIRAILCKLFYGTEDILKQLVQSGNTAAIWLFCFLKL